MASVCASSRLNRSQYVQSKPVHECGGMSKSMSPIVSNSAGCSFIVPLFCLVASVLGGRATRNAATRRRAHRVGWAMSRHPRLSYGRGLRLPLRWYVCDSIFMRRWRTVKHFATIAACRACSGLFVGSTGLGGCAGTPVVACLQRRSLGSPRRGRKTLHQIHRMFPLAAPVHSFVITLNPRHDQRQVFVRHFNANDVETLVKCRLNRCP